MTESDILFEVLYYAFIELRLEGHNRSNKVVYHLSDLLHNMPAQLAQVTRGERTYSEVLEALETKAAAKNCSSWLENIYGEVGWSPPHPVEPKSVILKGSKSPTIPPPVKPES